MATPLELFNKAEGKSLTQIAKQGVGGWVLAMSLAAISGVQAIAELLWLPFRLLVDVGRESVNAFILEPFGIVGPAADVTSGEVSVFGIFALPVAVVIALGTLLIVVLYLQLSTSSNILPGLFIDNRLVDLIFTSPEEDAQGEE